MTKHRTEDVIELGGGLPGWLLRLLVGLAGTGAVLVQDDQQTSMLALLVLVGLAVIAAGMPASPAPALLIAAVAVLITAIGGDPLRPEVLVAVPLLHLVHVGSALAAVLPVRARIRPAALLRPARRFLAVQVLVFAVVGLAELLPTSRNTPTVELVGLVGTTGLALLAIRLLYRAR